MRALRILLLLGLALPWVAATAESVDPDLSRLLRETQQPKVHYGPARVGWNGPEVPMAHERVNPVYESLRLDSPAAIRQELKQILLPDWQILLALTALVLGLRMLRASQLTARAEATPSVVPFPAPRVPRQEAA